MKYFAAERSRAIKTIRLYLFILLFFLILSKAEWKPVGCYKQSDRALDEVLERVGSKPSISSRYGACVSEADKEGVKLFGMDEKRCWISQNPYSSYDKYGTSGHCKTKKGLSGGLSENDSVFVYIKDDQGIKISRFNSLFNNLS